MPLIDDEIRCATLVRAAPGVVYDALATAEGLDAWFTTGASVDARPGGTILFRWQDWGPSRYTGEDGGPVLEARPGERLVFQWSPDRSATYRTTVELDLEETGAGHTIVRLREHGYHDSKDGLRAMLGCATGWGEALALLKMHLEHGITY